MANTKTDFKNYLTSNKDKLDSNKFKWLTKEQTNSLYNEWKSTWTVANSYFKPITKVTPNEVKAPAKYTSPVSTLTNKYSLGNVSSWNTTSDKVTWTVDAMATTNKQLAKEKEDTLKAWAKEETDLITKKQEAEKTRSASEQALLDKNLSTDTSNVEARRKEADELLKRQEWIAARQANISAAQAWSSWLQMSEWTIQDMKNDIIAKYWTNLANAEQFRNTTNISLDKALSDIDNTYFGNTKNINTFLNWLTDEEAKPLINAVQKATEWNTQAIDDIKTYYNTLVQKKWNEELNRSLEEERYADNEKTWVKADNWKRLSLLQAELKTLWISDPYIANPEKFANMSFADALNTIAKDSNNKAAMDSIVASASQYWTLSSLPKVIQDYAKNMWEASLASQKRLDSTYENKKWNISPSEQMTWTKPTWVTTKELNSTNRNYIDNALKTLGKDKVIAKLNTALNSWKLSKANYDLSMSYLNNK